MTGFLLLRTAPARAIGLAWPILLGGATALQGQVVSGRIVDAESLGGIASAVVEVLDTDGVRLGIALTGGDGQFRVELQRSGGPLRLEAGALSHRRASVDSLRIGDGETLALPDILLDRAPLVLDTIVAEGQRPRLTPGREWIRQHQLLGEGTFLSGAVIAAEQPYSLGRYIAEQSSLWVSYDLRGRPSLAGRPGSATRCMDVLVNRWPLNSAGPEGILSGFTSVDEIPLEWIAAVEIYDSSRDLPPGYWFDATPGCGIVNIWLWNSW